MPEDSDAHAEHVGLECKAAWCERLLDGSKTVELRTYPLPQHLAGKRVWLLASRGEEGVAALGEAAEPGDPAAQIVGWVQFSWVKEYHTAEQWRGDADKHCVPPESPYAWQQGQEGSLYGWVVHARHRLAQPQPLPRLARIKRSLYAMESAPDYDS